MELTLWIVAGCPNDCGGDNRGTCDEGRCICEDGWELPTCDIQSAQVDNSTMEHSENYQCEEIDSIQSTLCSDIYTGICNAVCGN